MNSMTPSRRHRVFLFLFCTTILPLACGDDMTGDQPLPVPVVSGVSATTVAPGDTLVVTGSNFLVPADQNRVIFNNVASISVPFAATETQLTVVVDRNALSGPVSVTVAGQPQAGYGPALVVTRGVGDVWVYGDNGKPLELPHPTPLTQYLLIPHATDPGSPYTQNHPYEVASNNAPPPVLAATETAEQLTLREEFEARRWREAHELVAGLGSSPRGPSHAATSAAEPSQVRQFYVLNTTTGPTNRPSSFSVVTAIQRYSGSRCIIYADVDTLSDNNLTQSDFNDFGAQFDNQIDPTNVQYFGGYSDVDGNGRVIILVTPVVNLLTPPGSSGFIGGFFLSNDLFAPGQGANPGTTNFGEIFYVLAADPDAQWGNPFPPNYTAQENVKTIAHEHEHLISFSHRIFNQSSTIQVTWLEEGMAHIAEDLNGINTSNVNRAKLYLENPAAMSLEHNTSPLAQRGGIYLFLRLMGDRYGDDIFKKIVQSKCVGRSCIESVAGENFYQLVGEFLAALYLSGKGITADPRFNYQSIDLSNFQPVKATTFVAGTTASGTVRRATGALLLYVGATGSTSTITPSSTSSTIGLRTVVVQTQ